eukprot:m.73637 g.73637  ORF g.73637 m.73637 type:complete len:134 (-) comp8035_c0_seq1:97-498(-)
MPAQKAQSSSQPIKRWAFALGVAIPNFSLQTALATIRKELSFCRKMDIAVIGIVENMAGFVCPCCDQVSQLFGEEGAVESLAEEFGVPFLGRIPMDQSLGCHLERGENPFLDENPCLAAQQLLNLAKKINESA